MASLKDSKDYTPLPGDDSLERFTPIELRDRAQQPHEAKTQGLFKILIGVIAVLSGIIVVLSVRLWYLPVLYHSDVGVAMRFHPYDINLNIESPNKPCGNTPKEALQHGCYYDHIRTAWLPKACDDPELNRLFKEAVRHIPHYRDPEHTIRMSIEEKEWVEDNEIVYSSVEYHRHHCAFALIKFHRAVMAGAKLDSYLDVGHTQHCSLWLMNNTRPWDSLTIESEGTAYPDCKTLEEMQEWERYMANTLHLN